MNWKQRIEAAAIAALVAFLASVSHGVIGADAVGKVMNEIGLSSTQTK